MGVDHPTQCSSGLTGALPRLKRGLRMTVLCITVHMTKPCFSDAVVYIAKTLEPVITGVGNDW